MARIGVAISGGGHRATAWGLGALLALTDMDINGQVVSISSVSGGSIANGMAARAGAFDATDTAAFEAAIRPGVRNMATDGLFFFGPATDGWLLRFFVIAGLAVDLLVATVVATLAVGRDWNPAWFLLAGLLGVIGWFLAAKLPGRFRVALAVTLLLAGPIAAVAVALTREGGWGRIIPALLGLLLLTVLAFVVALRTFMDRSKVVDAALGKVHFHGDAGGPPTKLRDVDGTVHHVFCASELQSGDHVYLSPRLVYGYRVGMGKPGDLTLATAVQCSACLPGAFAPRSLPTTTFGLLRPWEVEGGRPPEVPDRIVVNDGGVYDNMADQWEQGMEKRAQRIPDGVPQEAAEELVVVNASKGLGWSDYPKSAVVSEVSGLSRTIDILYDVSTAHRRTAMIARFRASADLGKGLRGALVHISQSPYDVAKSFSTRSDAAGDRARTALQALGTLARGEDDWKALARSNPGVPTTLGKLGPSVTADLLEHAWVLTAVNVYVVLGYGEAVIDNLAALANRQRFEALCA